MSSERDQELIKEMGWQDFPDELQAQQLSLFYASLQIKIGLALEHALSDKQLTEFERVVARGDDEAATAWLKQAVPNYDEIANKELLALKRDLKKSAARFNETLAATAA